mgnify:CR=1 FL=1
MPRYIENPKPPKEHNKAVSFLGWLLLFLFVVVVLTWLTACGSPAPETGKVINRKYIPEHWEDGYETYYTDDYVCDYDPVYDYNTNRYENKYHCGYKQRSHQRYEEHHTWYDDEWKLLLRKCEQKDDGKEKCREGWRKVTQDEYNRHDIGDYYPNWQLSTSPSLRGLSR